VTLFAPCVQIDVEVGYTVQFWLRLTTAPSGSALCTIISDVTDTGTFGVRIGLDTNRKLSASFSTSACCTFRVCSRGLRFITVGVPCRAVVSW
jgi:hypothetical protein